MRCTIHKPDGSTVDFECTHTFSPEQIEWFQAGSALNIIRARRRLTPTDAWDPAQYAPLRRPSATSRSSTCSAWSSRSSGRSSSTSAAATGG